MTHVPEPQGGWLGVEAAVTLDNCEREAIHLPGRVQAHGAVLIVGAALGHPILQISENAAGLLGPAAGDVPSMLGRPLADVLGEGATAALLALPLDGPSVRPELISL